MILTSWTKHLLESLMFSWRLQHSRLSFVTKGAILLGHALVQKRGTSDRIWERRSRGNEAGDRCVGAFAVKRTPTKDFGKAFLRRHRAASQSGNRSCILDSLLRLTLQSGTLSRRREIGSHYLRAMTFSMQMIECIRRLSTEPTIVLNLVR